MQKIPFITLFLWLLLLAGYRFFPEILLMEVVKYPLVILFSILLPVSFWLTQQNTRKRYGALIFAGIFLFNSGMLILALTHNYTALTSFNNVSEASILPDLAEFLTTEKNVEKRRFVAQLFSQKYGVSVPYKVEGDDYALYVPTQTDREHYRANAALSAGKDSARMNLSAQIIELFFLLSLHTGIFFLVIIFLLLYEQRSPSTRTLESEFH